MLAGRSCCRATAAAAEAPSKSEAAIFEAIDPLGRPDKDRKVNSLRCDLVDRTHDASHEPDKEVAALMAISLHIKRRRALQPRGIAVRGTLCALGLRNAISAATSLSRFV